MADKGGNESGKETQAAAELLPVVKAEMRRLAALLTGQLPPGQTLQPTAMVHEAYLKLVRDKDPGWEGGRHFFSDAAHAMREVLIDQARRKGSLKRVGQAKRIDLTEGLALLQPPSDDVEALDEAIQQLEADEPRLAEIAPLRYYTGLTVEETTGVIGLSAITQSAFGTPNRSESATRRSAR
jgi:RNA polymerase sigma factor (TIGR02999 family)